MGFNRKITSIMEFLNKIPCINYGGCLISAIAIFDRLIKNNYNAELIFAYEHFDKYAYAYNINKLRNGERNITAPSHVLIKIDDDFYDCSGIVNINHFYYHHSISREEALYALRENCWNARFNRDKYLPIIEKYIGYKIL